MGNHSHVSSPRKLDFATVTEQLHEINERRFQGYFRIEEGEYWGEDESWCFYVEKREHPIFGFHITKTKRKIEGGHPRPGMEWCYWAWTVFQNELGVAWNGRIGDDGVEGTWAPKKDKYPTLNDYMERHKHLDEKQLKSLWDFACMGMPDQLKKIATR